MYFIQQGIFILRYRYLKILSGSIRKCWFSILGMKIGTGTVLPQLFITWPHHIAIGRNCTLEHHIYFKYDGIWKKGPRIKIGDNVFIGTACEFNIKEGINIGNDTLIASGCRFIDHDHGTELGKLIGQQLGAEKKIILGTDVWLGCNVVILKGVEIGDGAIIAAGAVVTKSILPYEIWAGVPAKKIGERYYL